MNCTECGSEVIVRSALGRPLCRPCLIRVTVRDFFLRLVLPGLAALFLFWLGGVWWGGTTNGGMWTFILVGFPFGFRRMTVWLTPTGYASVAGSVAILLVDALLGALIGWAILAWRVTSTALVTPFRVVKILRSKSVVYGADIYVEPEQDAIE